MTEKVDGRMIVAALLCMTIGPAIFLLMPIYVGALQSRMALGEADLGLLASADLIGIALASFLAPLWINRVPWRLFSAVSFAGLLLCNLLSLTVNEFNLLFTLRLLAGLCVGGVSAIVAAIFSHARSPDRLFAVAVIMQVTYQSIAFLVLPDFIETAGLPGFLWSVIVLQAIALAGITWFPRRPLLATASEAGAETNGGNSHLPAMLILLAMALFFVGQSSLWAFVELIGNGFGLSNTEVGYALAISTFIALAGPIWAAITGERYGRLWPVLIAGIGQILVLTFMDAANSVWLYAAMLTLFQLFWNMSLGYQFGALVAVDHSNRFVVLVGGAQCMGIAAGPILGGIAMESYGNPGLYAVSGAALILFLLAILPFLRTRASTIIPASVEAPA